jgi:hypothetical protein
MEVQVNLYPDLPNLVLWRITRLCPIRMTSLIETCGTIAIFIGKGQKKKGDAAKQGPFFLLLSPLNVVHIHTHPIQMMLSQMHHQYPEVAIHPHTLNTQRTETGVQFMISYWMTPQPPNDLLAGSHRLRIQTNVDSRIHMGQVL